METTVTGDFGTLVIETDMIDVSTNLPQADKKWTYTDREGHSHYWRDGYPTLESVADGEPYWCPDCNDEHQDAKLVCPLCGEAIRPGTFVDPTRRFAPGLKQAYLNGEPISGDQAEEILAARRARRAG